MKSIALGSVVFSRSGRDAGRFYVVIEIVDDEYVTIADGDLRRVDKPKLKKIKHLKPQGDVIVKIADKLAEGKKIFDAEVRSALRAYNGSI
ncbi:MAG: KOW domain-containing RNA-binding protein [Firmicutes bacterium]|uniref:KOW domain-containing RNA-binding protein n=1 Tax=Candidatus Stercoripulliclostridium pullicola TaxID=2840953 RepID=A0A940DI70_9FIRM|nr:KOW domain-containing RNA-binding protein [Candidatus Stercoripulliclostridium pullicola]